MNIMQTVKPLGKLTPQAQKVLDHLNSVGSISNVEANAVHRVRSLSRRITEIGDALYGTGFRVRKEFKRDVTDQRYVRYSLAEVN